MRNRVRERKRESESGKKRQSPEKRERSELGSAGEKRDWKIESE